MASTQTSSARAETAVGDGAVEQRLSPAFDRVGRGNEVAEVRLAASPPAQGVPAADSVLVHGACAAVDHAHLVNEHRIVGGDDEDVGPELRTDSGDKLFEKPSPTQTPVFSLRDHSITSWPVNHPAASRVLRASSTVRWPYVSIVVVIEA